MADLRGAGQGRLAPHRQVTRAPQKELVIKVRELDAGRMPWTAPQIIRQHTPYVAGERPMLEEWLEFRRLPHSSSSERPRPRQRCAGRSKEWQ